MTRARTSTSGFIWVFVLAVLGWAALLSSRPAAALIAIEIGREQDRIEINALGTAVNGVGDRLQMETAPGADGLTDRMSIPALTPGTNARWFVFALRNTSDTRLERWLAADRYNATGSGILWPRLDARQIEQVTPSLGFLPENLALDGADAFRLTIEPGQTVTFAVELAGDAVPRLTVARALDYEKRARNKQLFSGVLLGVTGLLAVFLSAVFAANHKVIFPAAALFTWCVLAYLCVDFGFWHKLFAVRPEDNAQYRAATEAGVAATLLIFAHTFLRLAAWHGFARLLLRLWIVAQLVLVGIAFIDPRLAATFARLSMGGIFALGSLFVVGLALRGQDRALSLVPTWMLLGVWMTGMWLVFGGRLQTDAAVTALTSGLVLIVLLIGFTVTQYAFRTSEATHAITTGDQGVRLLALENSGAALWEWTARRDEIKVGPAFEAALGLNAGDLHASVQAFLERMHPVDRDRLRQALDSLKESGRGDLRLEFRMRHLDNEYRWFALDAATDPDSEARRARCVGLVRETTDSRSAQERLGHETVHDSITGLPNRALFLDRLGIAVARAKSEPLIQPTVILVDVDRFAATATAEQHFEADGLLIALARRLAHLVGPSETLARIGGDQFGILLLAHRSPREVQAVADAMRNAVRALIRVGSVEIMPKAAIGFAIHDRTMSSVATDVLEDAEIAMRRARRTGHDAALAFTADLRTDRRHQALLEADLRDAIAKKQLTLQYQPIFLMRTQEIAGYEALVRWEHPRLGKIDPAEFVPIAEMSDLIVKLGSAVVAMAVADLKRWHQTYERAAAPLFVSVNVSRRQLMSSGLVAEIRDLIAGSQLPRGCLRLEITETLVMENPEHAATVLGDLAAAGAGLSLDDFGTGYSSLTYLNIFPFDTLKIDRALVHGSSEAGTVSAILRSIVSLAHELGKKVVAEGVETEQDASNLRSLGCEYAQGYFYGTPQSPRDVIQALKDLRKAERRLKSGGLLKRRERKQPAPTPAVPAEAAAAGPITVPAAAAARATPPPDARPSRLAQAARMVPVASRQATVRGVPPLPSHALAATNMPAPPLAARAVNGANRFRPVGGPPPLPPGAGVSPQMTSQSTVNNAQASLAELAVQMARPSPQAQMARPSPRAPDPGASVSPASLMNDLAATMATSSPARPAPQAAARIDLVPTEPAKPLDLSSLPPGIAASLARLAGQSQAPAAAEPPSATTPSKPDFASEIAKRIRAAGSGGGT
jgi:diguanylate cyclase (GGDEF)-like protein